MSNHRFFVYILFTKALLILGFYKIMISL